MKVIVFGATGFVGSEVTTQLLAQPDVSEVVCVTRRPTGRKDGKLREVIHIDFLTYEPDLLAQLAGAAGCIWALGGKVSDLGEEGFEQLTHAYPIAFAREVSDGLAAPFTFCYVSGAGADPSETARIPWERETRLYKGRTERDLAALAQSHPRLTVFSFRPGGILPRTASPLVRVLAGPISIPVVALAAAMIGTVKGKVRPLRSPVSNRQIKRLASGRPS
jgi:hypothetical protein